MESSSSSLDIPTGETEMTELTEGVGDVGLEEAEEEADNGRICNEWWLDDYRLGSIFPHLPRQSRV